MRHGRPLSLLLVALAGCGPVFYDLIDDATAGPTSSGTTGGTEPTGGSTHAPPPPPPPSCDNGVHDGLESDRDCGGPCPPCGQGQSCDAPHDCAPGQCLDGVCTAPECVTPDDCATLDPCRPGTCDVPAGRCVYLDLDAVGCDDGDACSVGDQCVAGKCTPGAPLDCSGLDGLCTAGACDPKNGCVAAPAHEGADCDADGIACTPPGKCFSGTCKEFGPPPPLFVEDFEGGLPPGWSAGPLWEFGPAKPSACAKSGSDDPPDDHTPGPGGGLAGAVIGGCMPTSPQPDACLTTPMIPLLPGPLWLTFWSRLSSPPGPALATVEVFADQKWTRVFDTKGAFYDEKEWTWHPIDLGQFKVPEIRVRFCHVQPTSVGDPFAGWSLDDVALGAACVP